MPKQKRYTLALERYLLWTRCTTPFDRFPAMEASVQLPVWRNGLWCPIEMGVCGHGNRFPPGWNAYQGPSVTAEEWLFQYETHGIASPSCSELDLLLVYWRGKRNRDFWTKELGWWKRYAAYYIDEEFLCFLTPECFLELFDHWPRSHVVRNIYDNHYPLRKKPKARTWRRIGSALWELLSSRTSSSSGGPIYEECFEEDCRMHSLGLEREVDGWRVVREAL